MTPELKKRIDKFHKIAPYSSMMNDHVASEIIQDLTKYIEELEKKLDIAKEALTKIGIGSDESDPRRGLIMHGLYMTSTACKALEEIRGEG